MAYRRRNQFRPESILRQAEGLIAINKVDAAYTALDEAITSSKRHQPWTPSLESMMIMHSKLAAQLQKNNKWALSQYRNLTPANPESFLIVVDSFLDQVESHVIFPGPAVEQSAEQNSAAEQTAELAEQSAEQCQLEEDEEVGFSPSTQRFFIEGLSASTTQTTSSRYPWDAFRTCLDVLKNFGKLDHVYHSVSLRAVSFLVRSRRSMDFKRLCETLRGHLGTVEKYQGQSHAVDLSDKRVLLNYVEVRTKQLEALCELDVWGEAFYVIEDVQNLVERLEAEDQEIPVAMRLAFFRALARLFWESDNLLLHAYARLLVFSTHRSFEFQSKSSTHRSFESNDTKNDNSELVDAAKECVLAALLVTQEDEDKQEGDHMYLLSGILQLSGFPKKSDLVRRLLSPSSSSHSPFAYLEPKFREMFDQLESGKSPLRLLKAANEFLPNTLSLSLFSRLASPRAFLLSTTDIRVRICSYSLSSPLLTVFITISLSSCSYEILPLIVELTVGDRDSLKPLTKSSNWEEAHGMVKLGAENDTV